MKTLKKIAFWIVSYSIRFVLFATISASVAVVIVGKSSDIKEVLTQTNSYQRFVPAVIEANKNAAQNSSSLNYEDQNIARIINESFPANDLKRVSENLVDNAYAWLDGDKQTLTFKADFTHNKLQLADKLSTYAFERLRKQPFCTRLPEVVNPLTIECQPAGYNLDEAEVSYRQQLLESDSFLSKTILTQDDLPKNGVGNTITEQYDFAPMAYRWLLRAPFILGGLFVLFGALYVLLSSRVRKGISGFGAILFTSGLSLAFFPILFDIVLPHFTKRYQVQSGTQGTQAIFTDVINHITNHFYTLFITIGIQLFVVGLCIYLLEKATRDENARYKNVEIKSGLSTSNQKSQPSPKSLRGKLSFNNVPIQSSDLPTKMNPKMIEENKKYALFKKKKKKQ